METPDHIKPFEAQLLPCPFCGGPGSLHWNEKQAAVWPCCDACDLEFDVYLKPADAVALWNKRVEQ